MIAMITEEVAVIMTAAVTMNDMIEDKMFIMLEVQDTRGVDEAEVNINLGAASPQTIQQCISKLGNILLNASRSRVCCFTNLTLL